MSFRDISQPCRHVSGRPILVFASGTAVMACSSREQFSTSIGSNLLLGACCASWLRLASSTSTLVCRGGSRSGGHPSASASKLFIFLTAAARSSPDMWFACKSYMVDRLSIVLTAEEIFSPGFFSLAMWLFKVSMMSTALVLGCASPVLCCRWEDSWRWRELRR